MSAFYDRISDQTEQLKHMLRDLDPDQIEALIAARGAAGGAVAADVDGVEGGFEAHTEVHNHVHQIHGKLKTTPSAYKAIVLLMSANEVLFLL